MNNFKLAITCGGTGGHFYPGLSIARAHQAQGGKVLLLLSGVHSAAQSKIADRFGIPAAELPRLPNPRNFRQMPQFLKGMFTGTSQALRLLREFQPDAMLGMGSFASLPAVIAARKLHVPLYLHDGNARIGRANRYLSSCAEFLGTAFPPVNAGKCRCPVECVGMPLRPELTDAPRISKTEAIAALNREFRSDLNPELPTILIFGGSQGASIFNETIPEAIGTISCRHPLQVLHLTGKRKLEETRKAYKAADYPCLLAESSEKMELFYQASDVAVCRSGGSTVAELAFFGRPALLVPYPFAAENHQCDNAAFLADEGGAILLLNANCTPVNVAAILDEFLSKPDELAFMSRNAARLARPDAARKMLEIITSNRRA